MESRQGQQPQRDIKNEVQDTQPEMCGNTSYFLKQGLDSKRLIAVILRNPEKIGNLCMLQ